MAPSVSQGQFYDYYTKNKRELSDPIYQPENTHKFCAASGTKFGPGGCMKSRGYYNTGGGGAFQGSTRFYCCAHDPVLLCRSPDKQVNESCAFCKKMLLAPERPVCLSAEYQELLDVIVSMVPSSEEKSQTAPPVSALRASISEQLAECEQDNLDPIEVGRKVAEDLKMICLTALQLVPREREGEYNEQNSGTNSEGAVQDGRNTVDELKQTENEIREAEQELLTINDACGSQIASIEAQFAEINDNTPVTNIVTQLVDAFQNDDSISQSRSLQSELKVMKEMESQELNLEQKVGIYVSFFKEYVLFNHKSCTYYWNFRYEEGRCFEAEHLIWRTKSTINELIEFTVPSPGEKQRLSEACDRLPVYQGLLKECEEKLCVYGKGIVDELWEKFSNEDAEDGALLPSDSVSQTGVVTTHPEPNNPETDPAADSGTDHTGGMSDAESYTVTTGTDSQRS